MIQTTIQTFRAMLGTLWLLGRVPVEADCPYCNRHNKRSKSVLGTDRRPKLAASGKIVCYNCGHDLRDTECEACRRNFEQRFEKVDQKASA